MLNAPMQTSISKTKSGGKKGFARVLVFTAVSSDSEDMSFAENFHKLPNS